MKIISESFTEFDCIYQAYSTEQAKRIIEKESIDILITDIEMPKERERPKVCVNLQTDVR